MEKSKGANPFLFDSSSPSSNAPFSFQKSQSQGQRGEEEEEQKSKQKKKQRDNNEGNQRGNHKETGERDLTTSEPRGGDLSSLGPEKRLRKRSEWEIILYEPNSKQAVLYEQNSSSIELKQITLGGYVGGNPGEEVQSHKQKVTKTSNDSFDLKGTKRRENKVNGDEEDALKDYLLLSANERRFSSGGDVDGSEIRTKRSKAADSSSVYSSLQQDLTGSRPRWASCSDITDHQAEGDGSDSSNNFDHASTRSRNSLVKFDFDRAKKLLLVASGPRNGNAASAAVSGEQQQEKKPSMGLVSGEERDINSASAGVAGDHREDKRGLPLLSVSFPQYNGLENEKKILGDPPLPKRGHSGDFGWYLKGDRVHRRFHGSPDEVDDDREDVTNGPLIEEMVELDICPLCKQSITEPVNRTFSGSLGDDDYGDDELTGMFKGGRRSYGMGSNQWPSGISSKDRVRSSSAELILSQPKYGPPMSQQSSPRLSHKLRKGRVSKSSINISEIENMSNADDEPINGKERRVRYASERLRTQECPENIKQSPVLIDHRYFAILDRINRLGVGKRTIGYNAPSTGGVSGPDSKSNVKRPSVNNYDDISSVAGVDSEVGGNSNEAEEEEALVLNEDLFNDGYYERFFVEDKKLGSGFRGQVYLCKHVLEGVLLGTFAVKKVPVGNDRSLLVKMLAEVHTLSGLHHPNVLEYKHAWIAHHQPALFGPKIPCLFILTEYAGWGNLAQYVWPPDRQKENTKARCGPIEGSQDFTSPDFIPSRAVELTEEEIWSFFIDMVLGIRHNHRHGIIHRDLKPQNLLLHKDDESQQYPRVMISDYGECEYLSQLGSRERTGYTGTIEFMAPEVLEKGVDGIYSRTYDCKSDIWSLGVILYSICFGCLPWKCDSTDEKGLEDEIVSFAAVEYPPGQGLKDDSGHNAKRAEKLIEKRIPFHRSRKMRLLISALMARYPGSRPSADDILQTLSAHGGISKLCPNYHSLHLFEGVQRNYAKMDGEANPLWPTKIRDRFYSHPSLVENSQKRKSEVQLKRMETPDNNKDDKGKESAAMQLDVVNANVSKDTLQSADSRWEKEKSLSLFPHFQRELHPHEQKEDIDVLGLHSLYFFAGIFKFGLLSTLCFPFAIRGELMVVILVCTSLISVFSTVKGTPAWFRLVLDSIANAVIWTYAFANAFSSSIDPKTDSFLSVCEPGVSMSRMVAGKIVHSLEYAAPSIASGLESASLNLLPLCVGVSMLLATVGMFALERRYFKKL
eukprot:Nk52_evm44s2579 gene=Nk52_evmTU44s2579